MSLDAAPFDREDIFTIHIPAGPDAEFTENAAVKVDHRLGMRGIHWPARVEMLEVWRQHPDVVGDRLQLARPAFLAGRTDMITFDEQHLQNAAPNVPHFIGLALHGLPVRRWRSAGRLHAVVDLDQTNPATAMRGKFRVKTQVRNIDASLQRGLHDRLTVLKGNAPPV